MANKAKHGEPMKHLLENMRAGCCAPWPFGHDSDGYPAIHVGGRSTRAHAYVCALVNGPRPTPKHHARHLCGKGHLGCFNADCVAWGTAKENHDDSVAHGTAIRGERVGTSKLTAIAVLEIRQKGASQRTLAKQHGVTQSLVSKIQSGVVWKHIGEPTAEDQIAALQLEREQV